MELLGLFRGIKLIRDIGELVYVGPCRACPSLKGGKREGREEGRIEGGVKGKG